MADSPLRTPVDQLLGSRSDLWRGRRRPDSAVFASGRADLDAWLPGGGWPRGRLIELLPQRPGSGELELLLPLLAERSRQGWPLMLIAPPFVPGPQRLQQAGVRLDRLVVVRAAAQALWAGEQALKSGLCGAIVLWHPRGRVEARAVRRLQLAAGQGSAPLFLCYQPSQQAPPSLAALRLAIRPGPELELLRGDDSRQRCLHLGRANVVELPLARA